MDKPIRYARIDLDVNIHPFGGHGRIGGIMTVADVDAIPRAGCLDIFLPAKVDGVPKTQIVSVGWAHVTAAIRLVDVVN